MAPEIRSHVGLHIDFGYEIDIYAFGIVMWQLFTGQSAEDFHSTKSNAATMFRKSSMFRLYPDVPSWLDKLVCRCTATNPQKRPTATEIRMTVLGNSKSKISKKSKEKKPTKRVGRERSKSGTRIVETGPPAYPDLSWEWRVSCSFTWHPFTSATQVLLEENYQNYISAHNSTNVLALSGFDPYRNCTCNMCYSSFELVDVESFATNYVARRKRIPSLLTETHSLILHCTQNHNGTCSVRVTGDPCEDCSDVCISVAYCYQNQGRYETSRVFTPSFPLQDISVENEWIHVVFELGEPH